ncbi:sugar phosphate isomerase/epimerase family protein [Chelativorans sp. YIM 93263]|uniref:sugar phosphate isomerase/epimerase family protein n=1 Tax=Chelativorans sp. YIM 93263 TaxID=2906648 RepID=UPI0023798B96|nr:sugar phosphate isomerase/epimerase family protein [Chelativorans sp. YIM 93263]
MIISLCNEVVRHLSFEEQCSLAASLRYDGLEVAPFTLSDNPARLTAKERRYLRQIAEDKGLRITGLHWLLTVPEGLSLTSGDPEVHRRTRDHMLAMVDLCADLGGSTLVHGSPGQRQCSSAESASKARDNAVALLIAAAEASEKAGVVYCIEPLAPAMTDFINTIAEAVELVEEISSPGFSAMLDTYAASHGEDSAPDRILDQWLPSGHIRHVHFNDRSKRGPGMGVDLFAPSVAVLSRHGYDGIIGVEPFDYSPEGGAAAAYSVGYIRGLIEMLEQDRG